ncbi:DNA methyltransferase [Klebsiella michiganensis]|nr:RNA methyltransferase [Klebsiella oxytoca]HDK7055912.1 RNA methyltransferase [Klebsiella pneumoniae]
MAELITELDWDFKEKIISDSIHGIHPYPAKFIPEIPFQLINYLGCDKNTSVLDPFCGSGTTLKVAQSLGLPCVGIDLNPIACLISKVKTTKIPPNFGTVFNDVVADAKSRKVDIDELKTIPNINHWFKLDIQVNLLKLKKSIHDYLGHDTFDALCVAFSSIIVKASNQESDTRYAAINKNLAAEDVFRLFLVSCEKLNSSLLYNSSEFPCQIINKDVLAVQPSDINSTVGLVVTSPPYPNAYEYWLYHKYRMWWLGFDPKEIKEKEIGARAHFFKKNHHTERDFYHQMYGTLQLIDSVLITHGHAAFVVGRSIIHGKNVDNADLIVEAAENLGFEVVERFNRSMNSNRKSFNLSYAKIKEETIVVLRKK